MGRIVDGIGIYTGRTINPQESVIVFDEVQLCEKALNSLRFFARLPYRVLATGSLLGVTLKNDETNERTLPFPSDVQHVEIHPMDFEEFLWALDRRSLAHGIRGCYEESRPLFLHDEAIELYRTYLVVGGMPQAVAAYTAGEDFSRVREIQSEIDATYISDMPVKSAALAANGVRTFYWTPGDASGEVESVTSTLAGDILPIEVKSGANTRSRSLRRYRELCGAPLAIRVSTREFGLEDDLKSVPLYATFCIDQNEG